MTKLKPYLVLFVGVVLSLVVISYIRPMLANVPVLNRA
jgi:hypothetical protein